MKPRVALPAALFLLSLVGCGGTTTGLPYLGIGKLPLSVLAVTNVDPDTANVASRVYLRWPGQPGAKSYEVIRTFGATPAKVVSPQADANYTDTSLAANQSATYKVRALSGDTKELNASDDLAVTVAPQTVAKPDGLSPADNAILGVGEQPTFKWNAVPSASYYYVRVTRSDNNAQAFGAVTKDTMIKFGDPSPLAFSSFGDLFDTKTSAGITTGFIYHWSVEAIRADGGAKPDDAKAVDLNTSAVLRFSQGG